MSAPSSLVISSVDSSISVEIDNILALSLASEDHEGHEDTFEVVSKQLRKKVTSLSLRVATAGNKPRSEIDPLVFSLNQKEPNLQALEDVASLVSSTDSSGSPSAVSSNLNLSTKSANRNSVVPSNFPLFQWDGCVCDSKAKVSADIEECLCRFEDALSSHSVDYTTRIGIVCYFVA
ncbi:hypothetical protein INT46_011391 [Mucor plumbeus]|uniref:Uncharacterized protein n=1 Tax=Mucor plumbeus TaxID=97098 RepID=A0A8H7QCH9_9FUNG|nr:hypothetical protein INT46_011391 [Mucor plumbeus]